MTTKSIKLSEETYRKLVEIAGKLQAELKKPVSIEDAIMPCRTKPTQNNTQ